MLLLLALFACGRAESALSLDTRQLLSIPPLASPATNRVTIVDVMIVYTAAAREGAGGSDAIETLLDLAVAQANTVFQNSAIDARLRLVYLGEVAYEETANHATNLARLRELNDGFLDGVHQLREVYQADLVTLVTESSEPDAGGLAFTMGEPSPGFKDYAFSVTARRALVDTFIYVHEISHNFGAQHDRDHAVDGEGNLSPGSFSFSFGHRFEAGGVLYRDVMAYAPGRQLPLISNPDVLYAGVPTGLSGTNGANNAATLNATAPIVGALFGPWVQTTPPQIALTLPSGGTVFRSGTNLVLAAQMNDPDGTIQHVEFYAENIRIARLAFPASSTVWSNVPPGIYRVTARAIDDSGASSAALPVTVTVRPENDNLAESRLLAGESPSVVGSNKAASTEPGEPIHAGNPGAGSVWYRWQAPRNGTVNATVNADDAAPLVEAYRYSAMAELETVSHAFEFDGDSLTGRTTFDVSAGAVYLIAVDTLVPNAGAFTLRLAYIDAPANDGFLQRQHVSGENFALSGTNRSATLEQGEPAHADVEGGKSVWYSWTAPKAGLASVTVTAVTFFPLVDAYSGSTWETLARVSGRTVTFHEADIATTVVFPVVAGQNYSLAVDGFTGGSGEFTLSLGYASPPANDNLSQRITLTGTTVTLEASNLNATMEAGEPAHAGLLGGASVWYRWTAPVSGPVIVSCEGDAFYPLLAAYQGNSPATLIPAAEQSFSVSPNGTATELTFHAVALQTYALAVDGFQGRSGPFRLTLQTQNRPPTLTSFIPKHSSPRSVKFGISGTPGQQVALECSSDLMNWSEMLRGTFVTDSLELSEISTESTSHLFFRIRPVP